VPSLASYSGSHASGTAQLIACPECDLVQREPRTASGTVTCRRCGATLARRVPRALDAALSLMLASAVLFVIANAYPVMSLDLQGRRTSDTLFGVSRALAEAGMTSVALLVFVTVVLMPALEIAAMLYMLLPLRLGTVPRSLGPVARLLDAVRPWAMVEVFVLGALVAIGRLHHVADLELHPAFWAIGAVMFLLAVLDSIFDERALWQRVAAIRRSRRHERAN
jgi:paraquat-inducible protein A